MSVTSSIELQVISKLLTSDDEAEVNLLSSFDASYYVVLKEHIQFILDHQSKYGNVPDVFTFQAQFPNLDLVTVNEPLTYLARGIKENKQRILLVETFNKIKDLGSGDVKAAWRYLYKQCDKASELSESTPMDIIKDAKQRSEEVIDSANMEKIPTGFPELDKILYGGLQTDQELMIILARTNTGKSWICIKMMESAQKNKFPVLYYSPEMRASYVGTRFDTWRGHFQNSQIFQGKYSDQYKEYIELLSEEETSAYVIEDKDMSEGRVNVTNISNFVRQHGIKLVIIDGLSYMSDDSGNLTEPDHIKYKNICEDLYRMSHIYKCAVVIAVQANRETRESKDDKGEPFPNLYNIASSDHPARISTFAVALRQVFDKHVMDIRIEKSRYSSSVHKILSYSWDANTGNMQYLPGDDSEDPVSSVSMPTVNISTAHTMDSDASIMDDTEFEEEVEF